MKLTALILVLFLVTPMFARCQTDNQGYFSSSDEKKYYDDLFAYADTLKVIDGHEHMVSAETHVKHYLSFWDFFSSYVVWDLYSAGMPKKIPVLSPKKRSGSHYLV